MSNEQIKLFENSPIRNYWDDDAEEWFFCILDVVGALTDSVNPSDYFKKLRIRDKELDDFVRGTNCPPHQFISSDGKRHNPKCINLQGIFRIIQSIPSPKAEPFKRWLSQVGAERIRQMQDPELSRQEGCQQHKHETLSRKPTAIPAY